MIDPEPSIADETIAFWSGFAHDDLVARTAALHRQRRLLMEKLPAERVEGARYAIASCFLRGNGLEVGAGSRPYPLPEGATAALGDVRDSNELRDYFGAEVAIHTRIDAQTFHGVEDNSQDFVISAHVIEHLMDPIGSIEQGIRVIKPGGHYLLSVPDLRYTFDKLRQPTHLDHLLADWRDGGHGSRISDYIDFLRFVEPYFGKPAMGDDELLGCARDASARNADIHFHTWTFDSFHEMLRAVDDNIGFDIVCAIGNIVNESIFVLRKRSLGR